MAQFVDDPRGERDSECGNTLCSHPAFMHTDDGALVRLEDRRSAHARVRTNIKQYALDILGVVVWRNGRYVSALQNRTYPVLLLDTEVVVPLE